MNLQPHIPKIVLGVGVGVVLLSLVTTNKNNPNYDSGDSNNQPSTITDQEAKQKADTLYEAMNGMGTDEDMIFATLTGLTVADYNKVDSAFGYRSYNTYTGTSTGGINKYPLKTWLKEELSSSDYITLKNNFPNL